MYTENTDFCLIKGHRETKQIQTSQKYLGDGKNQLLLYQQRRCIVFANVHLNKQQMWR